MSESVPVPLAPLQPIPYLPVNQKTEIKAPATLSPRGAAIVTAIFFIGLLIQMYRHIMWRDELRTWQICTDATGLISLYNLMRFDAVPFVWNWIVFVLTRLTSNPASMQVVHALLASAVVYVVARWSPFSRAAKILFAFGYYPFFEYGVLARNYAPLNLLIFIACALISRPRVPLVGLAIICFFMSNVSIWGIGFAVLIFAIALIKMKVNRDPGFSWDKAALAQGIVLLGIGLCLTQLFPGPGQSFRGQWLDEDMTWFKRGLITLSTYYRAMLPIPDVSPRWWNSNIMDHFRNSKGIFTWSYAIQAFLGVMLLAGTVVLFLRRPLALLLFAAGATGLLGFTFASFMGYNRHHGYLFILLVASMWLAQTASPVGKWGWDWTERWRERIFTILLGVNVAIAVPVVIAGLIMPFSATWEVAKYIEKNFGNKTALVAMTDYAASPISQWLGRPIGYLQTGTLGTYNTQNDAIRSAPLTDIRQTVSMVHDATLAQHYADVVVMLNCGLSFTAENDGDVAFFHIDTGKEIHAHIGLIREKFDNSVVDDEVQRLYFFHFYD